MAASYPGAAKIFATRTLGQAIAPSHVNDIQDEVTAIETDLLNGLPVTRGGTGLTAGSAGGVPIFTGTTTLVSTAAGGATTFLRGGATPAFSALAGSDLTSAGASRVFDRKVTLATLANSTAETPMYTCSVPGGALSTNKFLRFVMVGDYLNNTGSADIFTVRVKYGATTLLTYALNIAQNANRRSLRWDVILAEEGAPNAQSVWGASWIGDPNTIAGTLSSPGTVAHGTNTATEDSTAAKNFVLTFQHTTADANLSARLQFALLELCE